MSYNNELLDINWSEPFEMATPTSEDSIPEAYIQCLQKFFGHSRFRTMQWKVISSILHDARDNCVIMATGYGKSLCYQFPSVYRDTITIVVSPLISLMQDQVLAMRFSNLRACFLGSAQMKRETVHEVIDRQYNIVYVTPEYITSESGTFLLERIREHLTLIAIDEAHCISKWGHDFRSAYRNLSKLRAQCPSVPILAMTATATEQVRDDIIHSLQLSNAQIVATGFDRPNLEFIVQKSSDPWLDIGTYIKNVKIGSVIVYCITRRYAEEVASIISSQGYLCGVYHAGRSLKHRQTIHNDFIRDRIRVVVATIAFGMGINKPDVRLVIHYGVAKDVESYYQEVGRAGRDGLPAKCVMFYQKKDWTLHRMIRERSKVVASKEQMESLMLAMSKYVDSTKCRRRFILSYFGEDCSKLHNRQDCCDNCRRAYFFTNSQSSTNLFQKYKGVGEDGLLDITNESLKMLTLLRDMGDKYGVRKAFLVLRGSKSKLVPPQLISHPLYGSLRDKSEKWLEAISNSLMHIQMLAMIEVTQANLFCQYVQSRCTVTSKAKVWLSGIIKQDPIKIVPGEEIIGLLKPKVQGIPKILQIADRKPINQPSTSSAATSITSTVALTPPKPSTDIYRPLVKVRSKLARLFDVMPYLVASTRALQQLAKIQPTTMEELRSIRLDGYSEEKTQRFGPVFLKVIRDYLAKMRKTTNSMSLAKMFQPKPVETKIESIEASTSVPTSGPELNSDVSDNNQSNETTTLPNDSPADAIPKIEEPYENSQDSLEIIEEPSPPIIVIDSDIENAIFTDWDSDTDDVQWPQINGIAVKQENNTKEQLACCNNQLDLLIDALNSEDLNPEPTNVNKKPSAALQFENSTDSGSDIFDEDWDLDINDSDLTQVSEQAELQIRLSAGEANATSTVPTPATNLAVTKGAKTCEPKLESKQNTRKPRIIQRKVPEIFEYEDDSSSESECDSKPTESPKKRALPSWMQLSSKKKR